MKSYLDLFQNIIDVFAFYDRPVLFISEISNTKYICELINENQESEEWLISDITDHTYYSLKALEMDLYDCFKSSKSGKSKILHIGNSQIQSIDELLSIDIPDENLPIKGIYIREKNKDEPFSCNTLHL